MGISVRNVEKRFGTFTALGNVSVDVPDGSLTALLGLSLLVLFAIGGVRRRATRHDG